MKTLLVLGLLAVLIICEDPYPANFQGNFDSSEAYPDHSNQENSAHHF